MGKRMVPCDHPSVALKTEAIFERVMGRRKHTGERVYYACEKCGEREGFENLSILTAAEYNRKHAVVE